MFELLLKLNLVLHIERVGARWHHLFRETYITAVGVTHGNTALDCGTAGSRFSDPRVPAKFRVWYGAADFRPAFLETVVRDALSFTYLFREHQCFIPMAKLDSWAFSPRT